ncbi:hypothetical protein T492DRAFT_243016 [Pavlovales sp. CCMP2436]|nr:hypothetical protein T492DRAFT_243016 [Pavlovales sp. CCMP2436]
MTTRMPSQVFFFLRIGRRLIRLYHSTGALAWLKNCYERREKWAYRYTWAYRHTWKCFTAGSNSTQRAEAVHSALKIGVDQTHLLVELIKYVEKYEEIKEIRNELKATRTAVKHVCNTTTELPIVQKLIRDGMITPYAVERVKAQAVLSLTYQVCVAPNPTNFS